MKYSTTCTCIHTRHLAHHNQILRNNILNSQVNALEILKELGPLLTATQIGILQTSSTKVVRDYVKTIREERDEALQVLTIRS